MFPSRSVWQRFLASVSERIWSRPAKPQRLRRQTNRAFGAGRQVEALEPKTVLTDITNLTVTPNKTEGEAATLTGDFANAPAGQQISILVEWGDGTSNTYTYDAGTTSFSETHTYAQDSLTESGGVYDVDAWVVQTPATSGGETMVPTTTDRSETNPVVAMATDGSYVVAWSTYDSGIDEFLIRFQRYNASGVAQGTETATHTVVSDGEIRDRTLPAIAAADDGRFVIAWRQINFAAGTWDVRAQQFAADGTKVGGEVLVSQASSSNQIGKIDIAMHSDGDYVVAWEDSRGGDLDVYARRYASGGTPEGTEFRVNTHTSLYQENMSVAVTSDGGFVAVWQSQGQDFSGDLSGVYGQRYDASGNSVGAEFQVNTTTAGSQQDPAIVVASDNSFVVVWSQVQHGGTTAGIFGQRYDASGAKIGGEFAIVNYFASLPEIAMAADGRFAVTWTSFNADGSGEGLQSRLFSAEGRALSGVVNVNTTTGNNQGLSDIGMDSSGNFTIVWVSEHNGESEDDVFAQRYSASDSASTTVAISNAAPALTLNAVPDIAPGGVATLSGTIGDPGTSDALTLTVDWGDGTVENFNYVAGTTSFSETHDYPDNDTADHPNGYTITTTLKDDATPAASSPQRTASVGYTNQAPTLTATPDSVLSYTEDSGAVALFTNVTITDPDDTQLSQAVVQITGNYDADEDVLALSSSLPDGITTSGFNSTTGTLTLSGNASFADYVTAIKLVTYSNSVADTTATRTVTLTITDANSLASASGTQTAFDTRSINITKSNDAPTVDVTPDTALSYTEDSGAVALFSGVTIADPDDTQLSQAVVQITGNYDADEDVLALSSSLPDGITSTGFNSTTGTLTLSGNASFADYVTALKLVTYSNSVADSTTTRTVTLTVTDANSSIASNGTRTASDTRTITVAKSNDAPTLNVTPDTAFDYIEDDATALLTGMTVTDADDTRLSQVTVQITSGYDASEDVLAFSGTLPDGITTTGFDSTTGTLTLSGNASFSDYAVVLGHVTYSNSVANSTVTRTVTVTITDANSTTAANGTRTATDTRTINVSKKNDAPTIDVTPDAALDYTEDNTTALFTDVTINDADDTQLLRAVVQITANYDASEDVLALSASLPDGITTTGFDSMTGTLILSGDASFTAYVTALKLITYSNSVADSTATRTVTVTIGDANGTEAANGVRIGSDTRTIDITKSNDAPTVDVTPDTAFDYTEDSGAVALFSGMTVTDADDTRIDLVILQITGNLDASEDLLSFSGPLPSSITFTAFSPMNGILMFGGAAPLEDFVTALQLVTYTNDTANSTAPRTVTITVRDANASSGSNGKQEASDTFTINVTKSNDAPTVSVTPASLLDYTEDDTTTLFTDVAIADADDTQLSQVTVQITSGYDSAEDLLALSDALPDGITSTGFDSTTGTLTLAGNALFADYVTALKLLTYTNSEGNSLAARTITITATDVNGTSSSNGVQTGSGTLTIDFTPLNDAPSLALTPDTDLTYREGNSPVRLFEAGAITDIDDPQLSGATVQITSGHAAGRDVLALDGTVSGLSASFDDSTGTLTISGTASRADYLSALQLVIFETAGGLEASNRTVTVTIIDANSSSAAGGTQAATDTRTIRLTPQPLATIAVDGDVTSHWNSVLEDNLPGTVEPRHWNADRTYIEPELARVDGENVIFTRDAETGVWYVSTITGGTDAGFSIESAWGTWEGWKAIASNWNQVIVGDFNTDGQQNDDVLGLTRSGGLWLMTTNASGDGFDEEHYIGGLLRTERWTDLNAADINGDGLTDIVVRSASGGGWWGLLRKSDNTGFAAPTWLQAWDRAQTWGDVKAVDLNHDTRTDLIGRSATTGEWVVMLAKSTGIGFENEQVLTTWDAANTYVDVTVQDVDGDGVTDLLGRAKETGEWLVSQGSIDSAEFSLSSSDVWATWDGWRLRRPWVNTTYGDFNADGNLDLVTQADHGATWWMMLANESGDGFDTPTAIDLFTPNATWSNLHAIDINHDFRTKTITYPRMDLIALSGDRSGWWIAESDPTQPNDPTAINARPTETGFQRNGRFDNIGQGDFNGDDRADLVGHEIATGAWWVLLAGDTDSGYLAPQRWEAFDDGWQLARTWDDLSIGDINGDGKDDVFVRHNRNGVYVLVANADGTGFQAERWLQGIGAAGTELFLLDLNGDGRDDLASYETATHRWSYAVARSDAIGFAALTPSQTWQDANWTDIQVGDVDGDGREDITARIDGSNELHAMLADSLIDGFQAVQRVGSFPAQESLDTVLLGDVTGDGRADLIARSKVDGKWHVLTATGNRIAPYASSTVWNTWTGWKNNATWENYLLTDVNNDGRLDILAETANGGRWLMLANSTGTGFETETYRGTW